MTPRIAANTTELSTDITALAAQADAALFAGRRQAAVDLIQMIYDICDHQTGLRHGASSDCPSTQTGLGSNL